MHKSVLHSIRTKGGSAIITNTTKPSKMLLATLLAISFILTLALLMSHYTGVMENRNNRFNIQLTEEAKLEVEMLRNGNKSAVLVPPERNSALYEVDQVQYSLRVNLVGKKLQQGQDYTLTIETSNVTIDGISTYSELVKLVFVDKDMLKEQASSTYTIDTEQTVELGIVLTLDEPANEEVALAIYNKVIDFTISLSATPNFSKEYLMGALK